MQFCTAVGRHLLARRWSTPDDRLPDSSLAYVARVLTAGATAQSYRDVRCGMRRPRWLRGLSAAPDTSNPIGINKRSSTLDHIEAERRLRRRVRRGHRRCTLAVRQGHGGGHRCRPQGIDHRDRSGSRAWGLLTTVTPDKFTGANRVLFVAGIGALLVGVGTAGAAIFPRHGLRRPEWQRDALHFSDLQQWQPGALAVHLARQTEHERLEALAIPAGAPPSR